MFPDTITAIATAPGIASIGVVRVSGALAENIITKIFKPYHPLPLLHSHHLYYGEIISPKTGKILDVALVTLMRAPHSYTGEDVLEIHAHGAPVVLTAILETIIELGARVAAPGEFTRRALLNGRFDVLQIEAIGDLLAARTPLAAEVALKGVRGEASQMITEIREEMLEILSQVEAHLDFGEDLAEGETETMLLAKLQGLSDKIASLSATYREGHLISSGISCPIVGRANVGKSSLLNALLGKKRALVAPQSGTTRDFIEEAMFHEGWEIRLCDTAGIRGEATDLEKAGIEFVWERLALADIALFLLDGSQPLTKEDKELAEKIDSRDFLVVINKNDLPAAFPLSEAAAIAPGREIISISAKDGSGIRELKTAIIHHFRESGSSETSRGVIITKARHQAALAGASSFLYQAATNLKAGAFAELIAQDIREALASISSITNVVDNEEILDRIFANFCVGK